MSETSRYKTMEQLCKDAITVQDACNSSGVALALVDAISFLRTLPECSGTEWIRNQACVVLFTFKLADLSGVADMGSERFSRAYAICKDVIDPAPSGMAWTTNEAGRRVLIYKTF